MLRIRNLKSGFLSKTIEMACRMDMSSLNSCLTRSVYREIKKTRMLETRKSQNEKGFDRLIVEGTRRYAPLSRWPEMFCRPPTLDLEELDSHPYRKGRNWKVIDISRISRHSFCTFDWIIRTKLDWEQSKHLSKSWSYKTEFSSLVR